MSSSSDSSDVFDPDKEEEAAKKKSKKVKKEKEKDAGSSSDSSSSGEKKKKKKKRSRSKDRKRKRSRSRSRDRKRRRPRSPVRRRRSPIRRRRSPPRARRRSPIKRRSRSRSRAEKKRSRSRSKSEEEPADEPIEKKLIGNIAKENHMLGASRRFQYLVQDKKRRSFIGYLENGHHEGFTEDQCVQWLETIMSSVQWRRLKGINTAWFTHGKCQCKLRTGRAQMQHKTIPPWLEEIIDTIFQKCGLAPKTGQKRYADSIEIDYYANGSCERNWHSDDHILFGGKRKAANRQNPTQPVELGDSKDLCTIVFVLGGSRPVEYKLHTTLQATPGSDEVMDSVILQDGEILTFEGNASRYYQRRWPNKYQIKEGQLVMTFRWIMQHEDECPITASFDQAPPSVKRTKDSGNPFCRAEVKVADIEKVEGVNYRVRNPGGIVVRTGILKLTDIVMRVACGTIVTVTKIQGNRCRLGHPCIGWCSLMSADGVKLLDQMKPDRAQKGDMVCTPDGVGVVERVTVNDGDIKQGRLVSKVYVRLDSGSRREYDIKQVRKKAETHQGNYMLSGLSSDGKHKLFTRITQKRFRVGSDKDKDEDSDKSS